jgi:pimeloyl-ACP methyl ester carboxylesterase
MTRLFVPAMVLAALVVGTTARGAAAQTPTVFLHGLASGPSTWSGAASRLAARVPIAPKIPSLGWDNPYGVQANRLNADPAYRNLPSSTIVVGHSNGGIVAREWSRVHPVSGIVTLGSPHAGVPLIRNFATWSAYERQTQPLANAAAFAFTQVTNWSGWSAAVQAWSNVVLDLSVQATTSLAAKLGLRGVLPVTTDMTPGSPYFRDLNSAANLAREASHIPARVGITSIAHNFFDAGWARVVAPTHADAIAVTQHSAEAVFYSMGTSIIFEADPTDWRAYQQAYALLNLAALIHNIDPLYCALISRVDASVCRPNDGLLSDETQAYPNAVNVTIGLDNNGPAHTQETAQSDAVLFQVFQNYMHVSPAAPPAPPPSQPPPSNPPPSDPPPSDPPPSQPPPSSDRADVLGQFERLYPNDVISSDDGRFHFIYQGDGNLVLYDQGWRPLWDTGTWGTDPGYVEMQGDGNLVMVNAAGGYVWDVGVSAGHPGAWLIVQDDGNVVIYDASSRPLWATNTVS